MFTNFGSSAVFRLWLTAILLGGVPVHACAAEKSSCTESGVALQILGSGGPIADDGRASSGYLVWIDGKSRFLIDAGGGVFLRFAEAGGNFSELDWIGISHFHADHSADLVALLKSGYFANRERDLPISGPAGSGSFPGLHDYLHRLLDSGSGAYGYIAGYLDGSGGLPLLDQIELDPGRQGAATILTDADSNTRVDALSYPMALFRPLRTAFRSGTKASFLQATKTAPVKNSSISRNMRACW